jgi:putative ABC transport system substrate-binding protein
MLGVRRREFITLLGGASAWPLTARAQQAERMRRVGVLMATAESDQEGQRYIKAFLQGLQALGWRHGRNIQIEFRWGGADANRIQTYAAELVRLKPDVILAQNSLAVVSLQRETRTIPIVFAQLSDPVESGFVTSLARPNGNITGFTPAEFSISGKWLELLKEVAPGVTRVVILFNPDQPPNVGMLRAIEAAAPSFGVSLTPIGVHSASEIERSLTAFAHEPNGGLIVVPNPVVIRNRELIIALAARHRLPAIYAYPYFVTEGGLMAYGIDPASLYPRAAGYIDRILKSEKVTELPVQTPTKYELVINLKTAKALGLDVPWILQQRADEVIE